MVGVKTGAWSECSIRFPAFFIEVCCIKLVFMCVAIAQARTHCGSRSWDPFGLPHVIS